MVFETTITTINTANAQHSYLIARMESAKQKIFLKYTAKPENSIVTGYLIDKHHNVIAYTFQGTTNETNKFLRDHPSTRIYSFSNLSVKQVTKYNWTSSLFSKELNLNRAKILPLPPHELNNYDIPLRRPATETVEHIIHRLESKNLTNTLADITALIVSTNNSKIVKKKETADYNIKEIQLSDGESIFDFTLWGADATGPLGNNMTLGDTITLLHAKVTLLETTDNQKVSFTLAKETGEILPDNISTRAKELLQNKNTILAAHQNNSLPTLTKTYIPKSATDFTVIPCEIINAQQLAIYLKQNEITEELTQLPTLQTQTQTEIKTPDRIYEIRNVTLTGLGNTTADSITYEACSICKKKTEKCNAKCPNAELILHVFSPNVEITDWSGTASNLLAAGEEFMTLLDTKNATLTQRIAQRNPSSLLFQTQTSIRVKVYENSYGDKIRTSCKIVAAQKRNFSEDLGKIYSTLSNDIERTNNIAYALLEDVTYEKAELTIAKQPTSYVVLYAIGCQDPAIETEGQKHKITNTVDILSTFDESFTRFRAECICDTNDLIRNKITENDHALLTVDHIDFCPETEEKSPLANITAVCIITNKQNDDATSETFKKQFITEAKHMKNALTRKPTQDPTFSPTTSYFLANIQTPPKKQKTSSSETPSTP